MPHLSADNLCFRLSAPFSAPFLQRGYPVHFILKKRAPSNKPPFRRSQAAPANPIYLFPVRLRLESTVSLPTDFNVCKIRLRRIRSKNPAAAFSFAGTIRRSPQQKPDRKALPIDYTYLSAVRILSHSSLNPRLSDKTPSAAQRFLSGCRRSTFPPPSFQNEVYHIFRFVLYSRSPPTCKTTLF